MKENEKILIENNNNKKEELFNNIINYNNHIENNIIYERKIKKNLINNSIKNEKNIRIIYLFVIPADTYPPPVQIPNAPIFFHLYMGELLNNLQHYECSLYVLLEFLGILVELNFVLGMENGE